MVPPAKSCHEFVDGNMGKWYHERNCFAGNICKRVAVVSPEAPWCQDGVSEKRCIHVHFHYRTRARGCTSQNPSEAPDALLAVTETVPKVLLLMGEGKSITRI